MDGDWRPTPDDRIADDGGTWPPLKPESGGLIERDTEPVHVKLIGQRVTIEGIETAWDRLSI